MTIPFHLIDLADKLWIDAHHAQSHFKGSEYTFFNNFIWHTTYRTGVAEVEGFFVLLCGKEAEDTSYLFPSGQGDWQALLPRLLEDAKARQIPFALRAINAEQKAFLEETFPQMFFFFPNRDNYEYIYLRETLASLAGKKLHAKRNHINQFKKNHPNWVFESITAENLPACIAMHEVWNAQKAQDSDIAEEHDAVHDALLHYEALGLVGGLLRSEAGGEVIAFSCGTASPDCDTFVVHIEKAHADMQGAYAMINQQMNLHLLGSYTYVNREDDVGDEGLRKAKLSYRPHMLEEKWTAILPEDIDKFPRARAHLDTLQAENGAEHAEHH